MGKRHDRLNVLVAVIVAVAAVVLIFLAFKAIGDRNRRKAADSATADASSEAIKEPVITLGLNDYTYTDDITNYLIIGTDHSGSYTTKATGKDYHGEMADFLLIISVNDTKGTYTLLPIDRDTLTEVDLMTTKGKSYASATEQICTAHWYGGNEQQSCENTVKAVSVLLGNLPIKGYYSIGMDSIKEINHAVGGVTVTVKGDFSTIDSTLKEGETIHLTDDQAFTYVHERMNMPDDDTNSARMERQQGYLDGFITAAKAQMKENPSFANDLFQDLEDLSVTDMNGHEISYLINTFAMKDLTGTLHIDGRYKEGKILDDNEKHGIFEADDSSIYDCLDKMLGLKAK
jgi:LCP family protein required for cell wall assembly